MIEAVPGMEPLRGGPMCPVNTAALGETAGKGSGEGGLWFPQPHTEPWQRRVALFLWQKWEITRFHLGCDYIWGFNCPLHSSCQAVSREPQLSPGWDMENRGGCPGTTRRIPRSGDLPGSQSPFHTARNAARGGWAQPCRPAHQP